MLNTFLAKILFVELIIAIAVLTGVAVMSSAVYHKWTGATDVAGVQCVQGFMFVVDARGNVRPATDKESHAVKCPA
jgi:hypothetical protein